MQILRLRATNFRRFDDVELTFSEGMNLVRGPNESGKSTIVAAILAGFFDRPQTDTAKAKSYMSWGGDEAPFIDVEFVHDGSRFHLIKDFDSRSVSLEEEGRAPLKSQKAVNARMLDLIGFGDAAKYLRTACVTHDQMVSLAEDSSGARKLAGMLRDVVVGSRETTLMDNAVKRLTSDIDGLKRGLERATNNPGTIRRLQDEREALIERQKTLMRGLSDVDSQRQRLAEIISLLEEQEPRLWELNDVLERNRLLGELERNLQDAQARFAAADRIREAERELWQIEDRIEKDFPGFNELAPDVDGTLRGEAEYRQSLKDLRGELSRAKADEPVTEHPAMPRTWWIGVGVGAVIIMVGIVLGVLQPALFSIIAIGIAVIIAASAVLRTGSASRVGGVPALDEQVDRTEAEIAKLEKDERDFLQSVGFEDAEGFLESFRSYRGFISERDKVIAGLNAMLGGRTREQVEEERSRASLDAAACTERLKELEPYRLGPERLVALSGERDRFAEEVGESTRQRDALTFHLLRTEIDPEEVARLEEELAWLWDTEQAARRRLRVFSLALDAMKQTAESLLASAVPLLSESVGRTFRVLTGGRYESVEVRETDLAISVYSKEKGEMIPADDLLGSLSKGTVSQLYLAARIELAGLLSKGRRPPLIFDDSFSYFDDKRLEFLWDVLMEVAREQQVIVLTCTDRYDRIAAQGVNVLDLDGS